jgi:hypothetical protein
MQQSVLKKVNKIISTSDFDKVWNYSDFQNLPFHSVAKAFSVLAQQGIVKRIEKGLYYKPKLTILGESIPDKLEIVYKKLRKKGGFFCESGLSGYNKLGFTTQVSQVTVIACNAKVVNIKMPNVAFIYRNKPHSGTKIERIILDALIDVDKIPDTTPNKIIKKIRDYINTKQVDINDLGHSALCEKPRVRALVGALGEELSMKKQLIKKLKDSLNPLTTYSITGLSVLEYAHRWNIKHVS